MTEFGWTTQPAGALDWLPERLRPGYISATLAALGHIDCGVAATILYTWVTPERDPANREDWFGIHPPRGAAPSVDARRSRRASVRRRARPRSIKLCAGS